MPVLDVGLELPLLGGAYGRLRQDRIAADHINIIHVACLRDMQPYPHLALQLFLSGGKRRTGVLGCVPAEEGGDETLAAEPGFSDVALAASDCAHSTVLTSTNEIVVG